MDRNETIAVDHFVLYTDVKLCCTSETYIIKINKCQTIKSKKDWWISIPLLPPKDKIDKLLTSEMKKGHYYRSHGHWKDNEGLLWTIFWPQVW